MICNCHIISNETDPDAAVAAARLKLMAESHPTRQAEVETVGLFMAPEIVPLGWGFPPRVVVTFDTVARTFDLPRAT